MNRIILGGFDGRNNPARIVTEQVKSPCRKLILPNDKESSVKLLLKAVKEERPACIVLLGRKPGICDKIAVEPKAARSGNILKTPLDCTVTRDIIKSFGCNAYISKGCGNSYCNHIYYEALNLGGAAIFLHIPTLSDISDITAVTKAVEGYLAKLDAVPCAYSLSINPTFM